MMTAFYVGYHEIFYAQDLLEMSIFVLILCITDPWCSLKLFNTAVFQICYVPHIELSSYVNDKLIQKTDENEMFSIFFI